MSRTPVNEMPRDQQRAVFHNIKNKPPQPQHKPPRVHHKTTPTKSTKKQYKNIDNREYIMGDIDHDGAKNIDDNKPYDPKDKSTVTDFSLAKDFEDIEREAESHRKPLAKIENRYQNQGYETASRVKSTHSAINKLKRKYLREIADLGGMTIFVDSIKDAYKVGDDIEKNYDVVYYDDYYKNPQGGTWVDYRALHYGVKVDGKIIEVQVKRKSDYERAQRTHAEYKSGAVTEEQVERSKEQKKMQTVNRKSLSRSEKINALMDGYGLSRQEAITELKDMGDY